MTLEGYCSCGRQSTGKYSYRRHDKYCSKYCHDFEEIEVKDGKTSYELWVGTGRYLDGGGMMGMTGRGGGQRVN